ncbi:MAG: hypothetical protein HC769_04305 [Cyanobacteria bacterium CRU_2_1]|nr:hypothetical protein [Hydrococcus sp. RU_2_2]NJR58138.1 hypothetical protein [Cyanobacteria bacterium CRU_2_1]
MIVRLNVPHITQSGAYPNDVNALSATHYFEISVTGQPLTQLLIKVPDRLTIRNINVVDQSLKAVDCTPFITNASVTVNFSKPIAPETRLIVSMQGIRYADRSEHTWLYPIYGKRINTTSATLLGIARIQTYKRQYQLCC